MAGAQRSILLRARVLLSAVERVQGVLCKAIGPGFVLLGMSLVLGVAYVCLIYSPLIPADVAGWKKFALYGFGIWIAFNILFNWSMCIITDPGTSPDTGLGTVEDVIVSESRDGNFVTNRRVIPPTDSVPSRSSKQPTFRPCRKCDKPKPPRAHHCSICDRCVLMMDHHCPWVNNCVGFRNYRFFVLFLFYMFAGCAYVSIVTMVYYPVLEKIGISQKLDLVGDDDGGMRLPVSREIGLNSALMFTFLLTSAVGVAVSLLLGFHIFLILTAQTTIEFHTNKLKASHFRHEGKIFINDYDLGKSRNWEQVFGKHRYPLAWLLPSTKPPKGDGVNWPTCKSIIYEDAAHIV